MKINIELMEQMRKQKGLSMAKMGELIGYKSEAAYQHKVRGRRKFTVEDLMKISLILRVELNELIKY